MKTSPKGKTVCRGLRIDQLLIGRIERAAEDGGFASPTAFMRAAIERELAGRESGVDASEARIAASLDRLAREIRGVKLGQQALFAFVDSLVKTLLTCIPEPSRDTYDQAVARGKFRYDRFLKQRRRRDCRRFTCRDGGAGKAERRKLTRLTETVAKTDSNMV
jgi:hypothetical protein